jgi:hypothetical protein
LKTDPTDALNKSSVSFTGSGNLGNIWFKDYRHRLSLEEIENNYPDLIDKITLRRCRNDNCEI